MQLSALGDSGAVPEGRRVEVIDDAASLAGLEREWFRLSEAHSPWLPFLAPKWCLTWWRHFAERGHLISDRLCVHAVRSGTGDLIAVAPLMLTERPGTGPLRIRMLQFLGADPLVTEARGVVCYPEHERAAYDAVFQHLSRDRLTWDFMRWSAVSSRAGHDVLSAEPGVYLARAPSSFVLDVPNSWEELRGSLPRNIKESLRKCYNSLKRAKLGFELRVCDGTAAGAALERFYELHALRARRYGTINHNDVFCSPEARAFLREYVETSAPGSSFVFQLVVEGEVVATRVAFRSGRRLYLYYSGYLPSFAQYSVMTTLTAEILKWSIAERIETVNLSFGRDVSKTRWRPREVPFYEAHWASPSLRGRMLRSAFRHVEELRRSQRFGAVTRSVLHQFGARANSVRG